MTTGRIFISYRRGLDNGITGRLHDRLERHFDRSQLFMDVDSIPLGRDFVDYLDEQVGSCDVFLAVIGPGWVDAAGRLDDPDDLVRIEIESALRRPEIPIIPVFVDDASLPVPGDLPDSLRSLARRNGIVVPHHSFAAVVDGKLTRALMDMLTVEEPAPDPSDEPPAQGGGAAIEPAPREEPDHPLEGRDVHGEDATRNLPDPEPVPPEEPGRSAAPPPEPHGGFALGAADPAETPSEPEEQSVRQPLPPPAPPARTKTPEPVGAVEAPSPTATAPRDATVGSGVPPAGDRPRGRGQPLPLIAGLGALAAVGVLMVVLMIGGEAELPAVEMSEEDALAALGGDPVKGKVTYRYCVGCHKAEVRQNGVGPHLVDVVGRPVGDLSDLFAYSEALLALRGDWTPERLDAYIADPLGWLPGTKMRHKGLKDPQDRADVIAYLRTTRLIVMPSPPREPEKGDLVSVDLGIFPNEAAARAAWVQMSTKTAAALLRERIGHIGTTSVGYHVRVGPLPSLFHARGLCTSVGEKGITCEPVAWPSGLP